MIISHKYQFIFVKTRKTAGTSIEVFLSRMCGDEDVVTPIFPAEEAHIPRNFSGYFNPIPEIVTGSTSGLKTTLRDFVRKNKFYNHIPASVIRSRVSRRVWSSYYKFCVERNPWDKTLSHYHMLNDRSGGDLSFDTYMAAGRYCLNYPVYTDPETGDVMVDHVANYEYLSEELEQIFGRLGIMFDGSLGVHAKSRHRKDRRPYQEAFPGKYREHIQQLFQKEIKLHGYTSTNAEAMQPSPDDRIDALPRGSGRRGT